MIFINALIIGGGNFLSNKRVMDLVDNSDIIIVADGAGKYLYDIGILPDVLVGDFDTLSVKLLEYYKNSETKVYTFPPEKDKTDLELSIDYAIEQGIKNITMIGVLGTRMDHSLGNIMLLFKLSDRGVKARIIDDNNEILVIEKEITLTKNKFDYVSIVPLLEDLIGVTLKGFEYDTKNEKFFKSSTYGISNRLIDEKGIIKIDSGRGLLILSRD
ncbi:thiamine diphosphokinase [Clostridium sp. D2Q-11]|uniref:Thiamine diphosphokinase n=1 Tax=Anaeromonas frigoriresistens TaxID=2683708 RepID=A0A942UV03_9FIRM|nr:thiamine diphosphokinase [Anaeromonas frigoriresistens]